MKAILHRVAWTVVEGLGALAGWSLEESLGICVPHTLCGFLSIWLLPPWQLELGAISLFWH